MVPWLIQTNANSQSIVLIITFRTGMLFKEREMLKRVLGHEPTKENIEDFCALKMENKAQSKTLQRENDKEKLRNFLKGCGGTFKDFS